MNSSAGGAGRVTGTPHVRAVPPWVARPLADVAWMEHALLWCYVEHGKSPEVHGARCALAWLGGVFPEAPATGEVAAPTEMRVCAELIICGELSRGDPYPAPNWWQEQGLRGFDSDDRRRWWNAWASFGWTQAIAEGVALALAWALDGADDRLPVLPRRYEDGYPASAETRAECAAAIEEALTRPMPALASRSAVGAG